jgi:hypothetical protein
MFTHDFVLRTFIVYITVKALIFLPLTWAAVVYWWADRKTSTATGPAVATPERAQALDSEELLDGAVDLA